MLNYIRNRWWMVLLIAVIWINAGVQAFIFFDNQRILNEESAVLRRHHFENLINHYLNEPNFDVMVVQGDNGNPIHLLGMGCEVKPRSDSKVDLTCHKVAGNPPEVLPETSTSSFKSAKILARWSTGMGRYFALENPTEEELAVFEKLVK